MIKFFKNTLLSLQMACFPSFIGLLWFLRCTDATRISLVQGIIFKANDQQIKPPTYSLQRRQHIFKHQ